VSEKATVFLLIGFSGTGKLTVAKALTARLLERGQPVRLIDNHYINNPILGLLDQDGVRPLPVGTWDRVAEVREAVVRTIETLSPPDWSFIFTNDLIDGPKERAWVHRLVAVADTRRSRLVAVRLLCDVDELSRRVVSPERRALMKWGDAEEIRRRAATEQVLDPDLPSTLTLDITSMPPLEAADRILGHLATMP
jgi:hypothetical protein